MSRRAAPSEAPWLPVTADLTELGYPRHQRQMSTLEGGNLRKGGGGDNPRGPEFLPVHLPWSRFSVTVGKMLPFIKVGWRE